MKKIRIWLLEKSIIKKESVLGLIVFLIIRNYTIDLNVRREHDYFTPLLFLAMLLWLFHSIIFETYQDSNEDQKRIRIRRLDDPDKTRDNFIGCALLYLAGHRLFFIYRDIGINMIIALICATVLLQGLEYIRYLIRINSIKGILKILKTAYLGISIFLFIYLAPLKAIYEYRWGSLVIGSYFEKEAYDVNHNLKIRRTDGGKTFQLPATIEVRAETRDDLFPTVLFSILSIFSIHSNVYQVRSVYFPNGGSLYFSHCDCCPIDGTFFDCTDQNGAEWEISLAK